MLADRTRSAETTGRLAAHPDNAEPSRKAPVRYAGAVTRAIALAVDALVIDVVALVVTGAVVLIFAVFSVTGRDHTVGAVVGGLAFVAWVIGYFVSFWVTTGQTPGSRVMQIRVVRTDGTRMRPRHALVRLGAMVLSLPFFWGYWAVLTSARRRGFPDGMAGTVVVVDDSREAGSA
jgi:uncharacterized RDD family membrane protein YckC